jgi:hypothetical protein
MPPVIVPLVPRASEVFAISTALKVFEPPERRNRDDQFLIEYYVQSHCSNGSPWFIHGFLKSSTRFVNSGQFANRASQRKLCREYNALICSPICSPTHFNLASSAVSNPS